ncbi:MAG: CoA ester lyase, partial [Alphaproteobacteria bacterium]|nr:CoA ester lyase [Alphaproteobacteria bacterium]
MPALPRPRRSVLYMPGSNARALDKARSLPADALIFDLEDAVAPDAKAVARRQVVEAARSKAYGRREIIIRVNGLDTPWGRDDIAAAAKSGADALLLPKVESRAMVREMEGLMDAAGGPADMAIWCMMETPKGILHAEEIASASARVACLVMGTSDLAKDLQARHTPLRLPMLTGLSLCLLAGRAFGLAVLDGVHLDLADDKGFEEACRQGIEFGFDGKTLIHPKTVETANKVFGPTADEIVWSRRIITAFEAAEREGKGVVLVDGKLIENLHVASARRVVGLAD